MGTMKNGWCVYLVNKLLSGCPSKSTSLPLLLLLARTTIDLLSTAD